MVCMVFFKKKNYFIYACSLSGAFFLCHGYFLSISFFDKFYHGIFTSDVLYKIPLLISSVCFDEKLCVKTFFLVFQCFVALEKISKRKTIFGQQKGMTYF